MTARRADALAIGLVLLGLAYSISIGLISDGFYQDDDITHYHFAADSWHSAESLWHRWARPGYNLPTALIARPFGFDGCRIFSAIQTAIVAGVAYLIARKFYGANLATALTPLLVWVQPMVFRLSTTTLTETTAMLYLTLAIWLLLNQRLVLGCFVTSLLFVTRDETLAMAPVTVLYVLVAFWNTTRPTDGQPSGTLQRVGAILKQPKLYACAVAMVWAPVTYILIALFAVDLPTDGSPLVIFSREYTPEYGSGAWYWYWAIYAEAAGVGVLMAGLCGVMAWFKRTWFVWLWVGGLLALHSLIYARGMFASGGYSRFLVPTSGLLAVLAAGGLLAMWTRPNRWRIAAIFVAAVSWFLLPAAIHPDHVPLSIVAIPAIFVGVMGVAIVGGFTKRSARIMGRIAACTCLFVAAMCFVTLQHLTAPSRMSNLPDHNIHRLAVDYLNANGYESATTLGQHSALRFLRPATTTLTGGNPPSIDHWRRAEPGTLFLWENKYCYKPHELDTTEALWAELNNTGTVIYEIEDRGLLMVVFEKK